MDQYKKFNDGLHRLGLITSLLSLVLLIGLPFIVALINGVTIDWKGFVSGIITVGIIYFPVSIVEFLVYAPMLGTGGSYLSFITGNVTNMKIPCVMNAKDIAKTTPGTPEHEIISTISVAISAITTTLVVVIGVILLVPL